MEWKKKQKEKQTTHKSLKRESQIEDKSSLIKVCTAQLSSKTLVKVFNDLALALDEKKVGILVLLDLSAAFDTIDQYILLRRCSNVFGITGSALSWIKSYMTGRTQSVNINGVHSDSQALKCGVPQGSVLGPLLFTMYTTPLGALLRAHDSSFHLYADDTQLYLVFEINQVSDACHQMEDTIDQVSLWMNQNMLKLNTSKTELLVICDKRQLTLLRETKLRVGSDIIVPATSARNIGATFNPTLSLVPHITNSAKSALFHLRNIGKIRKYLSSDAAAQLVLSLVTSRLYYANALLTNMPACHLKKLQHVQNIAARIVSKTRKYEHITPVLETLHWLPIPASGVARVLIVGGHLGGGARLPGGGAHMQFERICGKRLSLKQT